jgi:hypothetical protein
VAITVLVTLAAFELGLRFIFGMGHPVLYDNTFAYGYRPVPGQQLSRTARKRIRINNRSLRATRDWPALPDSSQLRLLYLGDSVTYGGSNIDDTETFCEISAADLTRRIGRDVLVGNAGVNGWGPQNILGLVHHEGFLGSRVVVVVGQEADFERALIHVAETPFWNRQPSSAIEELLSSHVAYPIGSRRFLPKEGFVSAAEMDSVQRSNLDAFIEVARRARSSGARVLMIWHPSRDAASGGPDDAHRQAYLARCRAEGFTTLDCYPIVRREPEPAQLYMDALHLDVRGHALYGRILAGALADLLRPPS